MTRQRTDELLRLLNTHAIEHVVVGGVAAIAWGASELTRDLDIVIPYDVEHISRLLEALMPLHPKHARARISGSSATVLHSSPRSACC